MLKPVLPCKTCHPLSGWGEEADLLPAPSTASSRLGGLRKPKAGFSASLGSDEEGLTFTIHQQQGIATAFL